MTHQLTVPRAEVSTTVTTTSESPSPSPALSHSLYPRRDLKCGGANAAAAFKPAIISPRTRRSIVHHAARLEHGRDVREALRLEAEAVAFLSLHPHAATGLLLDVAAQVAPAEVERMLQARGGLPPAASTLARVIDGARVAGGDPSTSPSSLPSTIQQVGEKGERAAALVQAIRRRVTDRITLDEIVALDARPLPRTAAERGSRRHFW